MEQRNSNQSILKLISYLQEFTENIRTTVNQVSNHIDHFQDKIRSIRRNKNHELQVKQSRAQMINKKKRLKSIRANKKISNFFEKINEKQQQIVDQKSVINVDMTQDINQHINEKEIKEEDPFSLDINLDLDDIFEQNEEQSVIMQLWNKFLKEETKRIHQIDPMASQEDIKKFAQIKWKEMTHSQKLSYNKQEKVKKKQNQKTKVKNTKENKKVVSQDGLKEFIAKKIVSKENKQVISEKRGNSQDQKVTLKKTTSTDELISAIQQEKEKKDDQNKQDPPLSSSGLRRILASYGI